MKSSDPIGIVGKVVSDKYRVESFVAEGGFAVVYRALHVIWNRPVAIKFFTALSLTSGGQRKELERAFINEGALLTELSSQTTAVVQARDVGSLILPNKQWTPYLVLEWVDGTSLDEFLEREQNSGAPPWSLEQVQRFLSRIVSAVAVVHRHGVAHRDLKPGNILVSGGDPRFDDVSVKILDFGVAKLMLDNAQFQAALTATGRTFTAFTPYYGAPEQFSRRFGATGPWTDVYALALMAVEMLAGRPALVGTDVAELSAESTNPRRRPTPRTLGVSVPDAVEAVFLKALALEPRDRYAGAGEFWSAFEAALGIRQADSVPPAATPEPPETETEAAPERRVRRSSTFARTLGIALVLTICLSSAVIWWFLRNQPKPAPLSAAAARPPAELPVAQAAVDAAAACPNGMDAIDSGLFFAGTDQAAAPKNQRPAHQVRLGRFCFDRHEVTVAEYKKCTDAGHCKEAPLDVDWPNIIGRDRLIFSVACNARYPDRGTHPINCVDWQMANDYCTSRGARLPTEAEWEYVARGPSVERYTWGEDPPSARLLNACGTECLKWSQRNDAGFRLLYYTDDRYPNTAPVESFPEGRSRFGPLDVAGNVREWVADWFGPYAAGASSNPTGPATGERRAVRGSSWTTGDERELRHTYRSSEAPSARRHDTGFRCARPGG